MAAIGKLRIIDRLMHWPGLKRADTQFTQAAFSNVYICPLRIASIAVSLVLHGGNDCRTNPNIRVQYAIARLGHRQNQTLHQFNRKLARMNGLFDVVVFHIWKHPHVTRIFTEGVARKLPNFRALEIFLSRILRRYADRIEVKRIIVAFGEPKDRLVPTG